MRTRYGAHPVSGCAGENVLIAPNTGIAPADAAAVFDGGIRIELDGGAFAHITDVHAALPCAPFSRWILCDAAPNAQTLKETLQF
jgi:hypothetical protein